jgi:hypothetical protein
MQTLAILFHAWSSNSRSPIHKKLILDLRKYSLKPKTKKNFAGLPKEVKFVLEIWKKFYSSRSISNLVFNTSNYILINPLTFRNH